jgi:hypothetical protein
LTEKSVLDRAKASGLDDRNGVRIEKYGLVVIVFFSQLGYKWHPLFTVESGPYGIGRSVLGRPRF